MVAGQQWREVQIRSLGTFCAESAVGSSLEFQRLTIDADGLEDHTDFLRASDCRCFHPWRSHFNPYLGEPGPVRRNPLECEEANAKQVSEKLGLPLGREQPAFVEFTKQCDYLRPEGRGDFFAALFGETNIGEAIGFGLIQLASM